MDKKIMTLGSILIAILVGVLLEYQRQDDSWELVYEAETSEQAREETVRGYKEPEELIAYMFYQIQNGGSRQPIETVRHMWEYQSCVWRIIMPSGSKNAEVLWGRGIM